MVTPPRERQFLCHGETGWRRDNSMQQFNIIFAPALHKFDLSLESRYIITVFSVYTVALLVGLCGFGWILCQGQVMSIISVAAELMNPSH